MKIMHVLKHARAGNGHVHVAVDLACAQADAGHEVTLASSGGHYDDLLRAHGVDVAFVPEAGTAFAAVKSAAALLRVARRRRPQIIHAHMMSSAVLAFPVTKLVRATLVTTVHNSFDAHSSLMRLGRVVVAVSEAEHGLLIARGFPPRKVVTVLNGAAASPRESLPIDPVGPLSTPSVLSLSGLHRRKAVGDVITAFAAVHPEFPDWHLNIVGSGPDLNLLEAQTRQLSLEDAVHFLGGTLTPKPLLEASGIFASASLAEPFGLTLAEARASGCAIVATSVGGVPEVLDHGRAGQLVPPSDPAAMADAFRSLMGDPATLAEWRSRARSGSEHLTVSRVARDYERVYRSVL